MSHPLDDVEFTPWGQMVTKELGILKDKSTLMSGQILELDMHVSTFSSKLEENTAIAKRTEDNTSWLVDAWKGAKVWAPVFKWIIYVVGGAMAIIIAWKALIK